MAEARTLDPGPIDPELRERTYRAAVEAHERYWLSQGVPMGPLDRERAWMHAKLYVDAAWGYLMSGSSLWMLDHMRETILEERNQLKFKVRELTAELDRLKEVAP